jgi:hypothetical protein
MGGLNRKPLVADGHRPCPPSVRNESVLASLCRYCFEEQLRGFVHALAKGPKQTRRQGFLRGHRGVVRICRANGSVAGFASLRLKTGGEKIAIAEPEEASICGGP